MNNKKRNKEIRQRLEIEKEKLKNPNFCFCDEPDFDINKPIGQKDTVHYTKYDYYSENPIFLDRMCFNHFF